MSPERKKKTTKSIALHGFLVISVPVRRLYKAVRPVMRILIFKTALSAEMIRASGVYKAQDIVVYPQLVLFVQYVMSHTFV